MRPSPSFGVAATSSSSLALPHSTEASFPGSTTTRTNIAVRLFLTLALVVSFLSIGSTTHAEEGVYVVDQGDSLAAIARAYSVSLTELIQDNGIANPNIIFVGQRLVIPGSAAATERAAADPNLLPSGSGYHTVQRGDTLAQISKDNGMTVDDAMRLNGLTNANLLWTGQKLRLSARVEAIRPEKQDEPAVASTIHIVQADETLEQIAQDNNISIHELMLANGLPNAGFVWAGQKLRLIASPTPESLIRTAPTDGVRWIEVNLSDQTLTAWQGNVPILYTAVSTGTYRTPTVTGRYAINTKYSSQRMTGPGYDLPGVPWVMYFYSGYAIHGAYWHSNWGTPMSHGCVNMRPDEAELLYSWADYGTEVYVHY